MCEPLLPALGNEQYHKCIILKLLILFASSTDKNPPHAGKAYKIRDIVIEYMTIDNCSPDIP